MDIYIFQPKAVVEVHGESCWLNLHETSRGKLTIFFPPNTPLEALEALATEFNRLQERPTCLSSSVSSPPSSTPGSSE
jgi:hypothetical protein